QRNEPVAKRAFSRGVADSETVLWTIGLCAAACILRRLKMSSIAVSNVPTTMAPSNDLSAEMEEEFSLSVVRK
ncbi:AAEL008033-PA, partial [Aedes aegypti]